MSLEATMICLDNSEWMRNGDYIPSRLEAQHDAANMLCGTKTQSNPESTVGILTMAGKGIQVLASPTENMGTLLNAIHGVSLGGSLKLSNAIQVAQLALKHRRNKAGGQRVILFVGSPIVEDEKNLVKMGKLLKKNNIAVDIVSLGDIEENIPKLQALVDAANTNSNSHLLGVPTGVLPSDVLINSEILLGSEATSQRGGGSGSTTGGATGAGAFAEYGGIDPSIDPELALALRVSMEEERARQEAAQKKAAEEAATATPAAPTAASAIAPSPSPASPKKVEDAKSETTKPAAANVPPPAPAPASAVPFTDPSFVTSLLSGLDGVDVNDPKVQAAMANLTKKDQKDEEKKEDK